MPTLRIVLDPEREGLGIPGLTEAVADGTVIELSDDTEIVVTCLPDGMAPGPDGRKRASIALAFTLPTGHLVVAQTSWRLFATAYASLLGKLGEPDMPGMRIEYPDEGRAIEFAESAEPFVQCGHCNWRLDGKNTKESAEYLMREYDRHYRKKHRGIPPPPPFPGRN